MGFASMRRYLEKACIVMTYVLDVAFWLFVAVLILRLSLPQ